MRSRVGWVLLASLTLGTATAGVDAVFNPGEAHAAVSIHVTLEELVRAADRVVVAEPLSHTAVWEEMGGSRRIVTYTRLRVRESIVGSEERELTVRTLGGVVDKIGQQVSGAAVLRERALVFLTDVQGVLMVTAMAQGTFRLVADAPNPGGSQTERVLPGHNLGEILRPPGPTISAHATLGGRTLDEARDQILRLRRAIDAEP